MTSMARKNSNIPDNMPEHLTTGKIPQKGDEVMLKNGQDVVLICNGPDGLDEGYGDFLYEDPRTRTIESLTIAYECVCPKEVRLAEILEELEDKYPKFPEHELLESDESSDDD